MNVKKQSHTWFMLSLKYSSKIIILTKGMSQTMLFLWQWLQKKISGKKDQQIGECLFFIVGYLTIYSGDL